MTYTGDPFSDLAAMLETEPTESIEEIAYRFLRLFELYAPSAVDAASLYVDQAMSLYYKATNGQA